jgi:glycosyltransferase involved in cell wall biosynthesis
VTDPAHEHPPLPRVSVVIPALNEARNLPHVLSRIPPGIHEVILVDGYSIDGTVTVARQLRPDVRIVRQNRTGKGNALVCGFALASGDIIAVIDADGSADPGEIPQFVNAILDGPDFAKGTRFVEGGGSNDITRLRSFGNRILTAIFNLCYHAHYTDLCYGFNVFWRRHVPALGLDATTPPPAHGNGRLWGDGFEIETLIHVRAAKAGLTVIEVPSFEHSRIHGVSNLNAFSDGARVLRTILIERHRAQRVQVETVTQILAKSRYSPVSELTHKDGNPPGSRPTKGVVITERHASKESQQCLPALMLISNHRTNRADCTSLPTIR